MPIISGPDPVRIDHFTCYTTMSTRTSIQRKLVGLIAVLCCLPLSLVAQEPAATFDKTVMTADWTRARDYTLEYVDAMPVEDYDLKPAPEVRSFAEQMIHLAAANFNFTSAATGMQPPYSQEDFASNESFMTQEGLRSLVEESYDFVLSAIEDMDESTLTETVSLFGQIELPAARAIEKAFEHQTHHRGQTTIYLRLAGVTPPGEKLF